MEVSVKEEVLESLHASRLNGIVPKDPPVLIELSDGSDSDSEAGNGRSGNNNGVRVFNNGNDGVSNRKRKFEDSGAVVPLNTAPASPPLPAITSGSENGNVGVTGQTSKQFWKAGDYEGSTHGDWDVSTGGMDHVRVHPKFLHSNATSHKWALGAFAELLDNALDEVCNGATFVNIDMLSNRKDGNQMLVIEDNGGGMDPDKMRQCMSLGYSAKSKVANTIGQYGNGFKTSTMRLGADVIVFSRCPGKDGKSPTQSIGLLSYTFLRSTGKEDIVVPMLDYEWKGREWKTLARFSIDDWNRNLKTIVRWSPFSCEIELLRQFNLMSNHGTRIVIYNLWEDDQGLLELDFDADAHDIQLRGVNRDEKNIQMASQFPNSRHFLTYRHSLRSYASILYLRLPPCFRIILRGKDVEHHNIVNDMMLSQEITYKPQIADGAPKDFNYMSAIVTIGFVKDAKHHIDVQGFNVYHKNRLIKPFWRLWNAAGSDGRGVIGVLEANFVEPAHDKQGFERTTVLARLESRLVQMQKTYWCTYCHKIGYAPRRNKKLINESSDGGSPPDSPQGPSQSKRYSALREKGFSHSDKFSTINLKAKGSDTAVRNGDVRRSDKFSPVNLKGKGSDAAVRNGDLRHSNRHVSSKGNGKIDTAPKFGRRSESESPSSPSSEDVVDVNDEDFAGLSRREGLRKTWLSSILEDATQRTATRSQSKAGDVDQSQQGVSEYALRTINQLKQENRELKERLEKRETELQSVAANGSKCDKCESLETQLQEAQRKIEELNVEQEDLIDIFSDERERRDREEEKLREKFKDASDTIQQLLDKVRLLERMKSPSYKAGHGGANN